MKVGRFLSPPQERFNYMCLMASFEMTACLVVVIEKIKLVVTIRFYVQQWE